MLQFYSEIATKLLLKESKLGNSMITKQVFGDCVLKKNKQYLHFQYSLAVVM